MPSHVNPAVPKLIFVLGVTERQADNLVNAGYDTPRKVKAVSFEDLETATNTATATAAQARYQ